MNIAHLRMLLASLFISINIKGKTGQVKCQTMLERREECDTYLTHVCRHQCSIENSVKR